VCAAKKKYPCSSCKGEATATVSREFSQDSETCPRCHGSGEEPEKFARQLRVADAIDQLGSFGTCYEWEGNQLRAQVQLSMLDALWEATFDIPGGFPRMARYFYGNQGPGIVLLFSPDD